MIGWSEELDKYHCTYLFFKKIGQSETRIACGGNVC
jgi:hypothetical protein